MQTEKRVLQEYSKEDESVVSGPPGPNTEEIRRGVEEFKRREKRDAMYKVASFLVSHFWGNHARTTEALGVLLMTWNQAFYRYGSFDFDRLETCIRDNWEKIQGFRNRELSSLAPSDQGEVTELFLDLMDALQIVSGLRAGAKSPVSVAKALHLLAPGFFPLWDDKIAGAYGCHYSRNPSKSYLKFCEKMRHLVELIDPSFRPPDRTILKVIDEYNYAKFTKAWI